MRNRMTALRRGSLTLPVTVAAVTIVLVVVLSSARGESIRVANVYDVFQNVADLGWVTLAIGLSMIVGEFDLSVPASYSLGGVVAILIGGNPVEGALLALGVGTVAGAIQGLVIARLSINSVPVTLVGYLVMLGLTGALLHENSLAYPHYGVGLRLDLPVIQVLSIRSLVAIGGFVALGVLMAVTRLGPQIRALGSERRAARVAGLPVNRLLVAVFALSGALSATAGALLDFSLATASPQVQLTPLVFAVTAAVIGGVGLAGGRGSALGIGIGVIALSVLQEGLVILNASDNVTNIATGGLLFVVALVAAPQLRTALRAPWLTWRRGGVETGQGG